MVTSANLMPMTLFVIAATLGCSNGRARPSSIDFTQVDTLVSVDDSLLVNPREIRIGPDNRIYVADDSRVLVLDPESGESHFMGREGQGPAEFRSIKAIGFIGEDTLAVVELGNFRVQLLSLDGQHIGMRQFPRYAFVGDVSLSPLHGIVGSTNGAHEVLAVRMDWSGEVIDSVGELPEDVTPWGSRSFADVKRDILNGEVPAVLRAISMPVLGDDGRIAVLRVADAQVQYFDSSGTRQWVVQIDDASMEATRDEFFAANRADPSPDRLVTLSYFATARFVGGELWILLRMPERAGARILVVDRAGAIVRQIAVPDAHEIRSFDVDPATRMLYLLGVFDGTILGVRLPVSAL